MYINIEETENGILYCNQYIRWKACCYYSYKNRIIAILFSINVTGVNYEIKNKIKKSVDVILLLAARVYMMITKCS